MTVPVYVTTDELRASLSVGGSYVDGGDDFNLAIETASRAVDAACDRVFYLRDQSNDAVRYYTPLRPLAVEIDDCVALTGLRTDQDGDGVFETTWTLHTDFELAPDNADLDGRPWERIIVKQFTAQYQLPYGIRRSVEVTGRFGWSETPSQVVSLTKLLAAQLILRTKQAPFGIAGIGVDGAVRIAREDPQMALLLRDLDRSPVFA